MMLNIKDEARQLIERLPEECSWEDVMYEIYVRKTIEAGLADSDAGRVTPVEEVRRRFGIDR
jgi:predicted transcriptional regulator